MAPITDPGELFASVRGVDGWDSTGSASYRVSVHQPMAVAPDLARAIVASGVGLVHLSEATHSLEDVYLQLVRDDVEAAR